MILSHDYFEKNLALLREHHPMAWKAVLDYVGEPLGELQAAVDGNPNLLIRKENGEEILLHDPRAPFSELAGYYNLVPENATGVAVFVGMGLGYTPPAMLASRPGLRHLLILEPEIGIFIQALRALDLTTLFSDSRVNIAVGRDIGIPALLAPMSRALQLESLYILQHTPCFRVAPEIYSLLNDETYKHGNLYNVGGNTTLAYGGKFIENRLRHLSAIHHQRMLENLKDVFAGVPAIIVAGGPSLNKNIHLLPQAKGRAVIIAADTVLPALVAHGVTPDFTSCIDMQDITFEKIVDVAGDARETSFICSSWLTPVVAKNFPARQVYWSFTAKNMEKWLNHLLGGKILTSGAGTVAQLNFTAAYLLGCSPIIFVGQDLAFSEQECHARHTSLTSKDELKGLLARGEIIWVDGYGGGKVPTYRAYLGFKHHFEQAMASIKDRRFINATEGGVHLDGTEELPLKDVLIRECHERVDVAHVIAEAEGRGGMMPGRKRMSGEFSRLLKAVAMLQKDMTRLNELAAHLSREVADLRGQGKICRRFEGLPASLQRQFQELDALNVKLDKAKVWALLDEATMEGLCMSERLNHEIRQLAEKPDQYLEWLDRAINRFILINRYRRQVLTPFASRLHNLLGHLQREDFLLKKLARQTTDNRETILDLLRLYFVSGDHALLEKAMAAHCPLPESSPELSFYLGVVAAHRSQCDAMEKHFSTVLGLDASWAERINGCRTELAERYLGFYREWRCNDRLVALRMLSKALRYTREHAQLRQTVNAEIDDILSCLKKTDAPDQENSLTEILETLHRELTENGNLAAIVEPARQAAIFFGYGQALFGREDFAGALASYELAADVAPEDAGIQVAIFEAAFNLGRFETGIAALERAVALDNSLARHWEEFGDLLLAAGHQADALTAYEKCFTHLPGCITLLKKIGDCYAALGHLEAALEAYDSFKKMLTPYEGSGEIRAL